MNNSICTLFDNILIDIHKFKSLRFKKNLMKFSNEEICKYFEVLITKRKELYKESIEMYDNESFTNSHI